MLWFLGVVLVLGFCLWLFLSLRSALPDSLCSVFLCFLLALAAVFFVLVGYNLRQLEKKGYPAKNKRDTLSKYLARSKSYILLRWRRRIKKAGHALAKRFTRNKITVLQRQLMLQTYCQAMSNSFTCYYTRLRLIVKRRAQSRSA